MWNGLPEIIQASHRDSKEAPKEKTNRQTPPKVSYRGITLKQYFRICQQSKPNETLRQIKEESCASENSSIAQTPTFNLQETNHNRRQKIKTEVCQMQSENVFKNSFGKMIDLEGKGKTNYVHSLEKNQKGGHFVLKKKEERRKVFTKIHSQPTKQQVNMLNRSTLTSFYQLQENKKRMLKKLQQEKERANDLRLSEAFFITKYDSRFRIDSKALKNN